LASTCAGNETNRGSERPPQQLLDAGDQAAEIERPGIEALLAGEGEEGLDQGDTPSSRLQRRL
jgi:hypothetical protein